MASCLLFGVTRPFQKTSTISEKNLLLDVTPIKKGSKIKTAKLLPLKLYLFIYMYRKPYFSSIPYLAHHVKSVIGMCALCMHRRPVCLHCEQDCHNLHYAGST